MFWFLLAAELSAPIWTNFRGLWRPSDMPEYHQRAGITRSLNYRVNISAAGDMTACEIEQSSGDAKLDDFTCRIVMKRGRFKPARWTDGTAVGGVFRGFMTWAIDTPPNNRPWNLLIRVDHLPKRVRRLYYVDVTFAVDETGRILFCAAKQARRDSQLLTQACNALAAAAFVKPLTGKDGRSERSVQTATVAFTTG